MQCLRENTARLSADLRRIGSVDDEAEVHAARMAAKRLLHDDYVHPSRHGRRQLPDTVAALDLGSNSFHMIVAQVKDGRLHVLDRLQEMARLAGGLDAREHLMPAARARALIA